MQMPRVIIHVLQCYFARNDTDNLCYVNRKFIDHRDYYHRLAKSSKDALE